VIAVDQRGRLGNAMFQWAFGFVVARRLGTSFRVDQTLLRPLFQLDGRVAGAVREARYEIRRRRTGLLPLEVDNVEPPKQVISALRDDTRYGGYFQSAQYLAGHEQAVREAFRLRAGAQRAYRDHHGGLSGHIAVHVRRGDYAEFNGGALLPIAWYDACLAAIGDRAGRPIVFVSDDLDWVRTTFRHHPNTRFVAASEAVDLQVLMHADALVLSPSSFSWWGAWLNRRSPQVFVPRDWINFRTGGGEYPAGVICPEWTKVDVGPAGRGTSGQAADQA
jgi:hypothetical protein